MTKIQKDVSHNNLPMATKLGKKSEIPVFKQIMDLIPPGLLAKSIRAYKSDKHCSCYFTYDQLAGMMFGQLNRCLSLREISLGIDQSPEFLYDIGLSQSPSKSSMSYGNGKRNYKVFEDLYYKLLSHYKHSMSRTEGYAVIEEVKNKNIKLVDATIMSVCLKLFSWAEYRTAKGGIKAHVCLDEATMLPEIVNITEAKVSDRRGVDSFRYPKDTIVVDDRGYFDCKLFKTRMTDGNHFVTRIKSNILYKTVRENELPDDKDFHILRDEIILLDGKPAKETGLDKEELRRVVVYIEDDNETIEIITNNLEWTAATIAELYKRRWMIEIFFKLVKQNLQVKTFLGTSENACKSQIFIALICYLLMELIRRVICKTPHRFGHFITLIRVCLTQYNRLGYVVNATQIKVRKARKHGTVPPDLFSNIPKEKDFEQLLLDFA